MLEFALMTKEEPARHDTITVSRHLNASPEAVFAVWADETTHDAWQPAPDGMRYVYEGRDFSIGGRERCDMRRGDEVLATFEHHYLDIVEGRRIVFAVRAVMPDGTLVGVSKNTVEFQPSGDGTLLLCTEQVTWFTPDSTREAHESGWEELLDGLAAYLDRRSRRPSG